MIILAGRWHISERVFMAVLPIRLFPDPVLRTRADEVTEFDGALEKLVEDMFDTMRADNGVGLAAPQVGVSQRLFVFDCGDEQSGYVINPVWEPIGDEMQYGMEGCLSVPGVYGNAITTLSYTVRTVTETMSAMKVPNCLHAVSSMRVTISTALCS